MDRSLTILLPIRHATQTLSATVHQLLDMLPDLTRQFEVLIVDDRSADATSELAYELARDYPQVRVVPGGEFGGKEAAIRAGLAQSRGEIVLLGEDGCTADLRQIDLLWRSLAGSAGRAIHTPSRSGVPTPRFQLLRQHSKDGPGLNSAPSPSRAGQPGRPNFLARLGSYTLED